MLMAGICPCIVLMSLWWHETAPLLCIDNRVDQWRVVSKQWPWISISNTNTMQGWMLWHQRLGRSIARCLIGPIWKEMCSENWTKCTCLLHSAFKLMLISGFLHIWTWIWCILDKLVLEGSKQGAVFFFIRKLECRQCMSFDALWHSYCTTAWWQISSTVTR